MLSNRKKYYYLFYFHLLNHFLTLTFRPLYLRFDLFEIPIRDGGSFEFIAFDKNSHTHLSSASHLKSADHCTGSGLTNLSFKNSWLFTKRALTVQASYSDGGRPSSGSIFISGFVLGGIVVGTLGAVYAPQISKALARADKKDLMRKLPKFIYDEEKALERTRKILSEKIEQLNSAIDDVSAQLRTEDSPNGVAVDADEIEAAI